MSRISFNLEALTPSKTLFQEQFLEAQLNNGLYLVHGQRNLHDAMSDLIVEFLHKEIRTKTSSNLSTNDGAIVRSTASTWGNLFWMDSGNMFDAYLISRMAASRGIDPKKVLRSLKVARPFTAFQFQQMLKKVPAASTFSALSYKKDQFSTVYSTAVTNMKPLVLISDLMALFYDPELKEDDLKRAYKEFILQLSILKERAVVVALVMDYRAPGDRGALLNPLERMASKIFSFEPLQVLSSHQNTFGSFIEKRNFSQSLNHSPRVANEGW